MLKLAHRVRAAQIPLPPSDERKKVVEDVDRDRRYSIDAAIVRTMKSRKVLQHQQVGCRCLSSVHVLALRQHDVGRLRNVHGISAQGNRCWHRWQETYRL